MNQPIIEIENLSKKYLISHEKHNPYASLKQILSDWMLETYWKILRQTKREPENSMEEFWALKGISLSIDPGDRVAVMGRNGAGKSTLLKILSRITEPTEGRVKIRGRVTSLLEVGTGFHPDLTGRENILLNGAIMGMSYSEMKSKFDEIVAFADVEKFLDTPIKRYSTGMFMRLGFAIAAHLDADLLIIDEVLAVGDAQFQEKCLKKMNEMGAQGRTVLFVSHSASSILSLCNKGIFLEKGELKAFEPIESCVNHYLRSCPVAGLKWEGIAGDDHLKVFELSVGTPKADAHFFLQGEQTTLKIDLEVLKPHPDLMLSFAVLNGADQIVARSRLCDQPSHSWKSGKQTLFFHLDLALFHPGEYQIKLESSLLNRKKILPDEVRLKFAVCSTQVTKHEYGVEKEGISLGNRWQLTVD